MKLKKNKTHSTKLSPLMSYQDRLRGYEQDKQKLLSTSAALPANEFSERLKALQNKWKI